MSSESTKTIFDPRSSEELFSKRRLVLSDKIALAGRDIPVVEILQRLGPILTPERVEKMQDVVAHRSFHLVSVLENIYDRGNVSAVMRSADAFGFFRMHLVDSPGAKFKAANRVSKGAEKWLDVHLHSSPGDAVDRLRADGYRIYSTDLATDVTTHTLDFSKKTAIVLGNEKDGVSAEMRGIVDGVFRIPMYGFSQSFNISVAAALIFYQARLAIKGGLSAESDLFKQVLANYFLRCFDSPEIYFTEKSR